MNLLKRLLPLALTVIPLSANASAQTPGWNATWQSSHGNASLTVSQNGYQTDLTRGRNAHPRHACGCPGGHYETRYEKVWVPGHSERIWVPPQIQVSYTPSGQRIETVVCPGRWEWIQHPGHYEKRAKQVWIRDPCRCNNRGRINRAPVRRTGGITVPRYRRW